MEEFEKYLKIAKRVFDRSGISGEVAGEFLAEDKVYCFTVLKKPNVFLVVGVDGSYLLTTSVVPQAKVLAAFKRGVRSQVLV